MVEKVAKKVSESVVVMNILMNQNHVNLFGKAHGGEILKLADEAAYVCACKHSGFQCVTASIDKVDFYSPVNIGDLLTIEACVNLVGKSSMEIGVKISAENLLTGEKLHTNSCYFTMVALNKEGKPVNEISGLILETDEQKRRNNEARIRRENRIEELKKRSKSA